MTHHPSRIAASAFIMLLAAFEVFAPAAAAAQPSPPAGHQVSCHPGKVETAHFTHTFDPAAFTASTLASNWTLTHPYPTAPRQTCAGQPAFVLELAYLLETAWERFARLQAMPVPNAGTLPVRYYGTLGVPMRFQHAAVVGLRSYDQEIGVNLTPEAKFATQDGFRQRTAHELFHYLQSAAVGADKTSKQSEGGLWWIEAAAEYASCDVVWPALSAQKGGGRGNAYPYLLDYPLWQSGAPPNDHGYRSSDFDDWVSGNELDYDRGYLIAFLVKKAAPASAPPAVLASTFAAMNAAVMTHFKNLPPPADRASLLTPLRDFLKMRGVTLSEAVREFAAFYFLSASSPLVQTRTDLGFTSTPLSATVKPCPSCQDRKGLGIPPERMRAPLAYTFFLPAGHTARLWALRLDPLPDGTGQPPRPFIVRATSLVQSRVQVFKGPWAPTEFPLDPTAYARSWIPGQPTPLADLSLVNTEAPVTLAAEETLYVIAAGINEAQDGSAVVTVSDAPALTVRPAACTAASPTLPVSLVATFESTPAAGRGVSIPVSFRWQWRASKGGTPQDVAGETKAVNPRTGTVDSTQPFSFPAPGSYSVTCVAVDAAGTPLARSSPVTCDVGADTPAATPPPATPPASRTPVGYWRFLKPRPLEYPTAPGDTSIVGKNFTIGEGSISGRLTTDSRTGEGPATWAGSCTWTWEGSGGLDRLAPGDTVRVIMTAADQSEPEKLSGWNHGTTGVSGSIRFDRAYQGWGVTNQSAVELVTVRAGWKATDPQKGSWTVPAGPGPIEWEGKAALVASCGFGRFERIYEWVGESGATSSAAPGAPAATPAAAPFDLGRVWNVKQWIGTDTWTWVWTRQGDSNTFVAIARNDRTGAESQHAIHFVSEKDGEVILSRPDANGRYIGKLSPDRRRVVSGTMDSVGGSQGWTAEIR